VVRLGDGADGNEGGRLAAGESSSVRFRVVVAPGASGSISSQAQVGVARASGGARVNTFTDANLEQPGADPTEIAIDDCAGDADCSAGFCDVAQSPQRCVECLVDAHCSALEPSCGPSGACACVPLAETSSPAGDEARCDGKDDDCDGAIDEGLAGVACNAGSDACPLPGVSACDGAGGVRCEASRPAPAELCSNGADDDCDGAADAADDDCAPPAVPIEGSSAGGSGSDAPLPVEPTAELPPPSTERPPVAPRPASPAITSVRNDGRSPSLDSPTAASLGGGGGCQLQAGSRGPMAPGFLLAAALLAQRLRRRPSARRRA
jgi:hypothetical protein